MERKTDEQKYGWTEKWMDRKIDGQKNKRTDSQTGIICFSYHKLDITSK